MGHPEPYCSIEQLPFDPHGWFFNQKAMEECLQKSKPQIVLEVGCWLGASTRFIGERLPTGGKLYAVDTWLGTPASEKHMQDPRLPNLFQHFLSNVKHAGLTDVIVPIRMDSLEAAKALQVQAELIYLDASHDTESVYKDIMAWYPHLKEGGVFCGDDWLSFPSVRLAVEKAAEELHLMVYTEENLWRFGK